MRRRTFLSSLAATLALGPLGVRASTLESSLRERIAQIPGVVGIYARTMAGDPPLVAYNAHDPFPAASTIKLLIMLTAFLAQEKIPGSLARTVMIRRSDLVGGSPFLASASAGQHYEVADLLVPMIQLSDNSAANALITHFGFERINETARRTGLSRTHLRRHFLDYGAIVHHHENVTTAADMGKLLYEIERGSREGLRTVASTRSCRRMIDIMLGQTDRDKIPAGLPAGVPVANKTGEVDGVRNDVAIVDPFGDSPFVLCILTKHVTDYGSALRGISAISNAVYWRVTHSQT